MGNDVSLSDFRGKIVFIDFWGSWCDPCREELPKLNALAKERGGDGVVVLAINEDKKKAHADKFLKRLPKLAENFIVLYDTDSKVVEAYMAGAMPTSYIVGKDGVIRYVHFGYTKKDPAKWTAEINALLK